MRFFCIKALIWVDVGVNSYEVAFPRSVSVFASIRPSVVPPKISSFMFGTPEALPCGHLSLSWTMRR